MLQWLRNWYDGELVIEPNEPDSVFILPFMYKRYHWTARVARIVVPFYLKNWQWLWLWGTIIAAASLWVAVVSLKS